jgi:hypothetical protein
MTFNRSVNRIQRIAHSASLDHLFGELISDYEKRVSLLRPLGKQEQAEQELKCWQERRSLINTFRFDDLLPTALRKQITDLELLRIKSKESQFGRANENYFELEMQKRFAIADMIRNRVVEPSTEVQSESLAHNC